MQLDGVKVISFSGIDGAGKSTQIEALSCFLGDFGLKCRVLTFWDDVVALSRFRERISSKAFRGDQGVGSPERPIVRRDKNVSAWYITAARMILYAIDAVSLCIVFSKNVDAADDVIIFDRYLYDELANLPLHNWVTRLFVRILLELVPRPDVAVILDAYPELATLRKPEYPLEFVRRNREAYLLLSRMAGLSVIAPAPVEETAGAVAELVSKRCFLKGDESVNLQLATETAKISKR